MREEKKQKDNIYPNVFIFMTDQLRYDACGCFGSKICRTPNLDRLAASGVAFTNAFTTAPVCSPTRASLMTGLYPHQHKILVNIQPITIHARNAIADNIPSLGKTFCNAGYETVYLGKWHLGDEDSVARQGFKTNLTPDFLAEWTERRKMRKRKFLEVDYIKYCIHPNYVLSGISDERADETRVHLQASEAIKWLKKWGEKREKPFFFFYSEPGPHPGYVVPKEYADLYNPDDIPKLPSYEDDLSGKPYAQHLQSRYTGAWEKDWPTWQRAIARYYSYITLIDKQLGRILDTIEELGIRDNTLILFVVDHGDILGEHQLFDKGHFMYDCQIHVPLVMSYPQVLPQGKYCSAQVSIVDLFPTLAEVIGEASTFNIEGKSLLSCAQGRVPHDWRDSSFIEYHGNGLSGYYMRCVHTNRYKYVYQPCDMDELYDLKNDPWELNNLSLDKSSRDLLLEMKKLLFAWMERTGDPLRNWLHHGYWDWNDRGNYCGSPDLWR